MPLLTDKDVQPDAVHGAPTDSQKTPAAGDVFVFPMSFAQQRLWLLDQFHPGNFSYNVPVFLRLIGPLDVNALERSLTEIVRRHEVLRATLRSHQGEPVQVISPPPKSISLPLVDLTDLPEAEREARAAELAGTESQTPFDLGTGPLLRASLVRVSAEDHVLLINLHHAVFDGWSRGILLRELAVLYGAYIQGTVAALPELTIQYTDFAVWQRQWLQGEELQKQISYWSKQLEGTPALLELPTDRPRTQLTSQRGAMERVVMSAQLRDSVSAFSRTSGVTTFMVLLAAYQILLAHRSGCRDLAVGTDVANRTQLETEKIIGFFINLLPLRLTLSGDPAFSEILKSVRETTLGAYAHQDIPFEKLVEELRPERSLTQNPLVQVLFVMQNIPKQPLQLSGLKVSRFQARVGSKFDMALFITEAPEGLSGAWVYKADLFDSTTILRLAAQYEALLRGIVTGGDPKLSMLFQVLSDFEKKQRQEQEKDFADASLKKLKNIKRKAVNSL